MSENHGLNSPENVRDTEQLHYVDIASAYKNALYGNGVSCVKNAGDWAGVFASVSKYIENNLADYWINDSTRTNMSYYGNFDPELVMPAIVDVLSPLNSITSEEYIAVNLQLNKYAPGSSLDMHYDFFDDSKPLHDSTKEECLTLLCVLGGHKSLVVQPRYAGEYPGEYASICQEPNMLVVLRGAAFEEGDVLYPAILHGVPPVIDESIILTFDLMRKSEAIDV